MQDQHVHANTPANGDAVPKFSVNHGTGFTGFGAVGWGFGNGLRVEAEGLYNFSHDSYNSGIWQNSVVTPGGSVLTPYHGTDLDVPNKNFVFKEDAYGNAYWITVQKIQEAPEYLTNPQEILQSANQTIKAGNSFPGVPQTPYMTNGGPAPNPDYAPSQDVWSPGADGVSGYNGNTTPFAAGTHEEMTSCSDCYFVSVLTPQQVQDLANGTPFTLDQSNLQANGKTFTLYRQKQRTSIIGFIRRVS